MRSYINYVKITSVPKPKTYSIVVISVCLLVNLSACRKRSSQPRPSPPDLRSCTRVEIKYYPSTMECIFLNPREQKLLNTAERQYFESLSTIIVEDSNVIKSLAHDLSSGRYSGTGHARAQRHIADVTCYHDNEHLISFKDYGSDIRTEDDHWFDYPRRSVRISTLTPQLDPFRLRATCSTHMSSCRSDMRLYLDDEYQASKWCDDIVRVLRANDFSKKEIMGDFKCPSAGEGKCHYALNPDCGPNSPPDTVLLFETKAGWNQHGGPELFTFDNHDPKGGCVLLNDGTVKFIRTKEELKQLRWE